MELVMGFSSPQLDRLSQLLHRKQRTAGDGAGTAVVEEQQNQTWSPGLWKLDRSGSCGIVTAVGVTAGVDLQGIPEVKAGDKVVLVGPTRADRGLDT